MIIIKNILTLFFIVPILSASAQTKHKNETAVYHKVIDEDGKTLYIKINGTRNNKSISFERTYHLKNKMQGDSIKRHVLDSLGVN